MSYVDDGSGSGGDDIFMKRFKLYKRKQPPPDFSDVIDFDTLSADVETIAGEKVVRVKLSGASVGSIDGLQDIADWKAYRIERLPGVTFIQNPFLPVYQRYWVCRCLAAYPLRPNVCNLDDDLHTDRGDPGDLWQQAHAHDPDAVLSKKDLLYKLRWVTLGYHYDWTKKVYVSSRWSRFPTDLADLSHCLASVLGYHSYNAEAAIVNYYHSDSTLSGHVDRSEFDKRAPLLSISFGQPAVFMVGGDTRQIEPVAMLLRSGDIVVLSDESRLAYHAVPRILSSDKALGCMLHHADSDGTNDIIEPLTSCNNGRCDNAIRKMTDGDYEFDRDGELECTGMHRKRAKIAGDARVSQAASAHEPAPAAQCQLAYQLSAFSAPADLRTTPASPPPEPCVGRIRYCSLTLSKVNDDNYWRPFESYVRSKRINMNVRQVVEPGTNIENYC